MHYAMVFDTDFNCVCCSAYLLVRPEIKVFGVSVHIVEPGFHATALIDIDSITRFAKEAWDRLSPALKKEYPEDYAAKGNDMIHILSCENNVMINEMQVT